MNAHFKHFSLNNSFPQVHPERPNGQIRGVPRNGTLQLVNDLESVVRRTISRVFHWWQRRTTIHKLQALNDHYLKDIGLDRSQIISSVDGIVETSGKPT